MEGGCEGGGCEWRGANFLCLKGGYMVLSGDTFA